MGVAVQVDLKAVALEVRTLQGALFSDRDLHDGVGVIKPLSVAEDLDAHPGLIAVEVRGGIDQ